MVREKYLGATQISDIFDTEDIEELNRRANTLIETPLYRLLKGSLHLTQLVGLLYLLFAVLFLAVSTFMVLSLTQSYSHKLLIIALLALNFFVLSSILLFIVLASLDATLKRILENLIDINKNLYDLWIYVGSRK